MNLSQTVRREPVVMVNAAIGLFEAAMPMAVAFGLQLTESQIAAIMGFAAALGVLINAVYVRNRVTPVADPRDAQGHVLVSSNS